MKLSMSRIDSCEKNLRISFMEKKYSGRTAISMPKKEAIKEEPLKEIFKRDSSPDSIKNDFDRPFRKIYYGPLPNYRSPSSMSLVPQRSARNVWQRIRSYMSTQKQKSYTGLRKMSSAFRKGKAKESRATPKEPGNPMAADNISGSSSKKDSKSKNLGFKMPIEDQDEDIHTPKVYKPTKSVLHKPQTPDISNEAGQKSITPGTISLDEGKSLFRGSSLNIKKTIVYTHDLLYLTEEDRKQKHEAERKKQEKEESTSKMNPESKRLHPLREGTQSLLDVINPLSRSPSSHDLNSSIKNVSKKPSVR